MIFVWQLSNDLGMLTQVNHNKRLINECEFKVNAAIYKVLEEDVA